MKKGLSILIEFLIYASFSLLALSYVLYYVYFISEREKSKLDIENLINILNELHGTLNIYKECGICSFVFKKNLPENAQIILVNNSKYINATYFSKTMYFPNYNDITIIYNRTSLGIYYIISKTTYQYFITNYQNLTISKSLCLRVYINFSNILIEQC